MASEQVIANEAITKAVAEATREAIQAVVSSANTFQMPNKYILHTHQYKPITA